MLHMFYLDCTELNFPTYKRGIKVTITIINNNYFFQMTSGEHSGELFSVHLQFENKIGFLNYNYFGSELGVNTLVLEHSLVASMQCGYIHSHIP